MSQQSATGKIRMRVLKQRVTKGNTINKQTLEKISCSIKDGINAIKIVVYHLTYQVSKAYKNKRHCQRRYGNMVT